MAEVLTFYYKNGNILNVKIKRGSIVETLVTVKDYRMEYPVNTQCQVLRLMRKDGKVMVKFKDSYCNIIIPLSEIKLVNQSNRKVPKVGDIFVASWGYGQSNNTWFKVKSVKNNTVTVVEVGETRTYTEPMAGNSLVNPVKEIGEPKDKRVIYDIEGNPSFKMASYARAFLVKDIDEPRFFSEWN
jgi:hypothetical protein